ncbi:hydantoinase B/oxoprolinase family protein, partial [Candidatus Bathyarchaeota archaeon]|nr:hydantoinase B/oxoprolinase family protein [Candidatus Bathyarchaeota archaeon]
YEGDELVVLTPGGGGYGDPLRRDPEKVLRDFLNGFVSAEAAERDYGVAIDGKTSKLDIVRTRRLRSRP